MAQSSLLPAPHAVLFDLGGTVLKETRLEPAALAICLGQRCGLAARERLAEADPFIEELYRTVRRKRKGDLTEVRFRSLLRLICERFELAAALELTPAALELEVWQAVCSMAPLPGVVDLLAGLRDRSIRTAIVSNAMFSGAVLEYELARNGLQQAFEFVIATGDYGIQKPHPAIFEVAAVKLGLPANQIWFIGDNLRNDVEGARQAGMTGLWYNPANRTCELDPPPPMVCRWDEFLTLLP
ncbi:HAD family hydrolase [Lignipirellula cremea]|uniref:Pyrimidine 5'-nucleotidase YjjG n=1 Tax=Lignipirellula cremea TaxID=2528010 RepID=A0A518DXX5_9BACT|nr:HAD family hydrolase [Lignipirellula cremea]QDU96698.1 Pyrimidine 5'-nucleotidase YjjG [Lignipirellula cremea]